MAREANTTELKHITTYVDVDTWKRIEEARGIYSRSSFVANVLEEVFLNFPEQGV